MTAQRTISGAGVAAGVGLLALLPLAGLPAFYDSFLYMIFYWISLATSWAILSGFAGYFSFGHAAFFGAGMYTTATLSTKFGVPFLVTLPAAAAVAAALAFGIGAVVFRLKRLRGELFALLTLAVSFVVATIILNTAIDGGAGVLTSSVSVPRLMPTPSGTIYLLGLIMCVGTLAITYAIAHSRLGLGLFAIHDDEDVAEVKGIPTFRYKLIAFAVSAAIAGAVGGVHAIYVGFLTVSETFGISVPLYVVLMSVLGGARHWLGPAVGAAIIAASLYAFTSGEQAMIGRGIVAFILVVAILILPEGIVPSLRRWWQRRQSRRAAPPAMADAPGIATVTAPREAGATVANLHPPTRVVLEVGDVHKAFGGLHALRGVTLDIREGEILGLVGPNGSGKTTLINVITGHFPLTSGSIRLDGMEIGNLAAHEIAARGVARTYQIPRPFTHLTVLDNVALAAAFGAADLGRAASLVEARRWLDFTGLRAKENVLPADLNLHERKFLELARALAARPRLLLLDEVLSGLNPAEIDRAIGMIREIRAQGTTIVFVEHLMRAVVELCDRIAVLNEGALFALGEAGAVMRDPRVVSIYLGKAHAA
ncbi:branched-chain amino acid ABC transporter ATP-binding protein/permease [Reyranella sp. CPCC 100927]|uniref:branched-chain amino acid ABC transporter ATP-binding protein/permease n=1 Tax=Reyranella sp. CPCC 100927 TaxID=2599616 RepID=UPI0011B759A1|nr:ATP-binding cassette domain-containing protein [Reyranella sp. CPCC 100927]TWT12916.1 ATP-binding cassette domain-containing protein [Reyranella sp. CPCC 100927]